MNLLAYPELCLIPFLISSLNMMEGEGSSEEVVRRDRRINTDNPMAQKTKAKKKNIPTANIPSERIPYLKMMNQVPMKQMIDQTSIE